MLAMHCCPIGITSQPSPGATLDLVQGYLTVYRVPSTLARLDSPFFRGNLQTLTLHLMRLNLILPLAYD